MSLEVWQPIQRLINALLKNISKLKISGKFLILKDLIIHHLLVLWVLLLFHISKTRKPFGWLEAATIKITLHWCRIYPSVRTPFHWMLTIILLQIRRDVTALWVWLMMILLSFLEELKSMKISFRLKPLNWDQLKTSFNQCSFMRTSSLDLTG